jgi:segregation and condensation protein A
MALSVKLEQFEGPLDLLLHLVDKQKVAIEDIFVSRITEQYMECMEGMSLDMETAGDFLAMAATLLYIKSRALLPAPPKEQTGEPEEDPAQELIRRLNEYRAYKQLCEALRAREQSARGRYIKLPEEAFFGQRDFELLGGDREALFEAFMAVLQRVRPQAALPVVREIRRETVTVEACMRRLVERLRKKPRMAFDELFEPGATRAEYVLTFVALLELMRESAVSVTQEGHGARLNIVYKQKRKVVS